MCNEVNEVEDWTETRILGTWKYYMKLKKRGRRMELTEGNACNGVNELVDWMGWRILCLLEGVQ